MGYSAVMMGTADMLGSRSRLRAAGFDERQAEAIESYVVAAMNRGRRPSDLARHPMAVALVVALLAFLGWMSLAVHDHSAKLAALEVGQSELSKDVAELNGDVAELKKAVERLEASQSEIMALLRARLTE